MGVRVLKKKQGYPEFAPPGVRHRRGWCRIGPAVTVWCSCGWKWKGEAKESEVEARFAAHLDGGWERTV